MSWQVIAAMTGATNRSHSRRWVSACLADHGWPPPVPGGDRYQAIRSAPGRSRFGASAGSRSVTFSSLAASRSSVAASHCRRAPFSYQTARHRPPRCRPGTPSPRTPTPPPHGLRSGRACREQSRCFLAAAGGAYLPGYAPRRRCPTRGVRLRRPLSSVDRLLGALEAKGGCIRVYFTGPPPVAARRDRNRLGEFRTMRQLVGGGPAELEEIANIPDADQPVSGPSGLPGGF